MPKTTTKKKVVAEKSVGDELVCALIGETYAKDTRFRSGCELYAELKIRHLSRSFICILGICRGN